MSTANDLSLLIGELAGHWTEPLLDILKSTGMRQVSVDMELEAWRTLKDTLHAELRWQQALRVSTLVSLSTLREQVLRKASLQMAQKFEPKSISYEFNSHVRQSSGARRSTAA